MNLEDLALGWMANNHSEDHCINSNTQGRTGPFANTRLSLN